MAKETPDGQQKTEDASGKRLSDARNRGQVAKSMDAVNASLLLFGGWVVFAFGSGIAQKVGDLTTYLLRQAPFISISDVSVPGYYTALIVFIASVLLPVTVVIMIIGVSTEVAQVGFHFATEKFTKGLNLRSVFNPASGLQRIFFSKSAYFELLKGLLKLLVFGGVVYQVLQSKVDIVFSLLQMPFTSMAAFMASTGFELVMKVGIVYALVGVADVVFQRRRFKDDMKMSKQEVKEETKQMEGDAVVKQRIRALARQRLRKLMLKNVKTADVIITNPTHYAIAISYKQGSMQAPKVVAKGIDFLALKIREIATDANVPIVENPPLARALYAACDIDQEIPENLFKGVAQVLAFVYKLRRSASR